MIISKTPFRISLFGGGTDLPEFLNHHKKGKCIGFSIDKYCYIFFRNRAKIMNYNYRISYSKIELKNKLIDIEHPGVKNTAKFYKFKDMFDMGYHGDLPARSGLGSSSCFTVGMCNIFRTLLKKEVSPYLLARDAINIEQNLIKEKVGSQDQILTSYGGFNVINFKKNSFKVKKIKLNPKSMSKLENSIMLFYTNQSRFASKIEKSKTQNIKKKIKSFEEILKCANEFENDIISNSIDIKKIGEMLDSTWQNKKQLSKSVSSSRIDEIYNYFIDQGVYGGKMIGAGGGGFLLFVMDQKTKSKIKSKLNNANLIDIKISNKGSQIVAID